MGKEVAGEEGLDPVAGGYGVFGPAPPALLLPGRLEVQARQEDPDAGILQHPLHHGLPARSGTHQVPAGDLFGVDLQGQGVLDEGAAGAGGEVEAQDTVGAAVAGDDAAVAVLTRAVQAPTYG